MLRNEFTAVLRARNREDLLREVLCFTRSLDFDTVAAMAVVDHVGCESKFASVHNTPEAHLESFQSHAKARRDPVMQYCKRSHMPIVWSRDTYAIDGKADMWEEQARHGFCTGTALALHLPKGRHFMVGVDRDRALPTDPDEISRMVADLHLFTVYAQEVGSSILFPGVPQETDVPELTSRELEGLRWTMEGKTAWELGRILGISEQTAVRHVNNATHKLGCVSKHHAVVKALRLGLIQ